MYVDHTIHNCYCFSVLKYNQVTLLISVQFCSEQNRQRGITEIYNSYHKYKNSDVITDLDKSDRVVLMKISVFSMQFSFFLSFSLDCYGPHIKVHFNELYCSPVKFCLFVERHIFTNTTIFVCILCKRECFGRQKGSKENENNYMKEVL